MKRSAWFSAIQPLDWFLVAVPVALATRFVPAWQNETLLFAVAALAVIPLAGWLGRATEHLAERAGPAIGGLLNATFGNAAELIIGLLALSHGLIGVVKASITGSIIGNILLVLGASMLGGGLRFPRQEFNQTAARVASTSLTLAAIGLIIPTVFHVTADQQPGGWTPQAEQRLSAAIAAVLFVTYLLSLLFSLVTHRELFSGKSSAAEDRKGHHPTPWSLTRSLIVLAVSTVLVAIMSELLVGSVESARQQPGLPKCSSA